MSSFYKNMPKEFREAVEVIKKYCQNEDCNITDCKDCTYPIKVIMGGDCLSCSNSMSTDDDKLVCVFTKDHKIVDEDGYCENFI